MLGINIYSSISERTGCLPYSTPNPSTSSLIDLLITKVNTLYGFDPLLQHKYLQDLILLKFFLSLIFGIVIIICPVDLFGSSCSGLCISWTCMSISFARRGNFSVIISSNRFSIPCTFSSFSGTLMMQMLDDAK